MSERLIEFLDLLNAATDTSHILEESSRFIVKKYTLKNCLMFFDNKEAAYFTPEQPLRSVVKMLAQQAMKDNSFVLVKHPDTDVMTSGSPEVEKVKECLLAFPLVIKGKTAGAFVFVADHDLGLAVAELRVLVDRIDVALNRAQLFKEVHQSSITDALTGMYNKAYFIESLKKEVERAQRNQHPISLIFFDFDDFKKYNDTHGHVAGDELLKQLGTLVRQNIRGVDIPCRFGGEEFVVVLPETGHEHAFATAERLRNKVSEARKTTISLGVITCLNASVSGETLLKEADKALYKAKSQGKNKTVNFVIVDKALGVIDVQDASGIGKL